MARYRRNRHRGRRFRPRHQSHRRKKNPIFTGIILILASLVLSRLSFTNTFLNSAEVFMWSMILSVGLFIAGVLVLVAWWRNHVFTMNTGHTVRFR